MNKNSNTVVHKCGTSNLARPKFSAGMLLQHDDLDQLSIYTRDLSRLLFRSLFGCGVVCGLTVKPAEDCGKVCIEVAAGVALNCAGDPIHVPEKVTLVLDENCSHELISPLWVVLCPSTKCCAPRPSTCASDDDEPQPVCTREREGYEISVVKKKPSCACQCEVPETFAPPTVDECRCIKPPYGCYEKHYAGECGCPCGDCSSECTDVCVVLASLSREGDGDAARWRAHHGVRRFIRPLLMVDPAVYPLTPPTNDQHTTPAAQQQQNAPAAQKQSPPASSKKASKPGGKRR